ncbi:MAG: hemerythrin domain-containing protein [Chloroflexota bacterium]
MPASEPSSLRATSAAHHAALLPHVDRLLEIAEAVGRVDCSALHDRFDVEYDFVAGQLVPHMDTVETTLYGHLEHLMGPRHTMEPMREEHATIRRLVSELGAYRAHGEDCAWSELEGLALRRTLYRLHALLKVHLAEEELYLGVLDRSLSDEEKDRLAHGLDHAMAEPL